MSCFINISYHFPSQKKKKKKNHSISHVRIKLMEANKRTNRAHFLNLRNQ